ncbi:nucleoid-associated protein [uncultured Clostridium sp.]|uniref:nucleoid-associated protein n=1 Tax=uncultured Clostridium sp. TaxID=59620 RepID=UPI002592C03F|nr:nucleoid-associated protein [uncultured Clostridium sp.]
MDFSNVKIQRIVIHEIFKLGENKEVIPPRYANKLSNLDISGKNVLQERIVSAIGSDSRSIEMEIVECNEESCVSIVNDLINVGDDEFIEVSKRIALKLANTQNNRKIPGGIVVIVQGTCGGQVSKKFVAIIKAELHSGFTRDDSIALQFISELLLTPQQKLYKIAAFIEDDTDTRKRLNERFSLTVYDNNMKKAETKELATYFYATFLGSEFKKNSKYITSNFYDYTKRFINGLDISDEEKIDLNSSLRTYVKSEINTTISVDEFASEYLSEDFRDEYKSKMEELNIPLTTISKDTTYLKNKLRERRIKFTNDFTLVGPEDKFSDSIKVIEPDENGNIVLDDTNNKTFLCISGKIKEQ